MTTQHEGRAIPTMDEFGARLALIRWTMGWNQKEAALACGLPHASWREWELSGRKPRNLYEVAQKISARTGINDVFWIMTGQTSNAPGPDGGSTTTEPLRLYQSAEFSPWRQTAQEALHSLTLRGEGVAA